MKAALSSTLALALALFASSSALAMPTPETNKPIRMMISGHSLTDLPFPSYLASVGQSVGSPIDWQRQYLVGSSIKDRVRGRGADSGWAGYRQGDNRSGSGLDILSEFKNRPYDVLMITEQHGVVDALVWHDSVRHLRHFHDQFIAGNSKGRTFFFEPWLGIPGKTDFKRWVTYERSAAPVWGCIVGRVNQSLAVAGRADRLQTIPAGLSLAELVERATAPSGLPGISQASPEATLQKLFRDDVHLNPLAFYYLALVSNSIISERTPLGAWVAEGITAEQAQSLQQVANQFVSRYRSTVRTPDSAACAKALNSDFLSLYFDHRRDEYWSQVEEQPLVKTWQRLKSEATMRWRLYRHNPLDWTTGSAEQVNWFTGP